MKFLINSATLLFVINGLILSSTAHVHGLNNINQGVQNPGFADGRPPLPNPNMQPIRHGSGFFMKTNQTMKNCFQKNVPPKAWRFKAMNMTRASFYEYMKNRGPGFGRRNSSCFGLMKDGKVRMPLKTTPPIPNLKANVPKTEVKKDSMVNVSDAEIAVAIVNALANAYSKNVNSKVSARDEAEEEESANVIARDENDAEDDDASENVYARDEAEEEESENLSARDVDDVEDEDASENIYARDGDEDMNETDANVQVQGEKEGENEIAGVNLNARDENTDKDKKDSNAQDKDDGDDDDDDDDDDNDDNEAETKAAKAKKV
jgi:hypothetical protein